MVLYNDCRLQVYVRKTAEEYAHLKNLRIANLPIASMVWCSYLSSSDEKMPGRSSSMLLFGGIAALLLDTAVSRHVLGPDSACLDFSNMAEFRCSGGGGSTL